MRILDTFCVCLCVWDGGWGVDWGWMPLPTRPQRYCDPASLVGMCVDGGCMPLPTRPQRYCDPASLVPQTSTSLSSPSNHQPPASILPSSLLLHFDLPPAVNQRERESGRNPFNSTTTPKTIVSIVATITAVAAIAFSTAELDC